MPIIMYRCCLYHAKLNRLVLTQMGNVSIPFHSATFGWKGWLLLSNQLHLTNDDGNDIFV